MKTKLVLTTLLSLTHLVSAQAAEYKVLADCQLPAGTVVTSKESESQDNLSVPNARYRVVLKQSTTVANERFASLIMENFPGFEAPTVPGLPSFSIPAGSLSVAILPINSIGLVIGGGPAYEFSTSKGYPFTLSEEEPGQITMSLKAIGQDIAATLNGQSEIKVTCSTWARQ